MASVDPSLSSEGNAKGASLLHRRGVRLVLAAFGWLNLALGAIGLFVPLMPTTVFLLIALWALSLSSAPGYRWLREHPRLGDTMRAWDEQRAIPPRAKAFALCGLLSTGILTGLFAHDRWIAVLIAVALVPVALYIATRPNGSTGAGPNRARST
ncbi:MAG TPA: YbaN family protein [Alphaproteobacteria bacterium]|nr:YbaN family protein [Alphaproteobacteria bacterium]